MTPSEIKQARHALGLSAQALADVLGCSLSAVQAWETAEGLAKHRRPDAIAIRAIGWLLDGYRPPEWRADKPK